MIRFSKAPDVNAIGDVNRVRSKAVKFSLFWGANFLDIAGVPGLAWNTEKAIQRRFSFRIRS